MTKPDAELTANILNGFQSKGSPMAMPPKGGNPNLTAADVKALVTYMRTLTGAFRITRSPGRLRAGFRPCSGDCTRNHWPYACACACAHPCRYNGSHFPCDCDCIGVGVGDSNRN